MSNATWNEPVNRLRTAAISTAWRQWRAVGASAAVEPARAVVDPEALLLLTLVLTPFEPRLADLWRSWVALNADLLSVQRAKNLAKRFPATARESLAAVGTVAFEEARDWRWRKLSDPGAAPVGRAGKRRAVPVSFDSAATLMLQLRRGLGVGIKADTLAYLLTTGESGSTAAEVAAGIGYTGSNVRSSLDDLASARFILAGPSTGRALGRAAATYGARRTQWGALLGLGTPLPPWRYWSDRFAFVAALLSWVDQLSGRQVSDYAFAAKVDDLVSSCPLAFPTSWDMTGSEARQAGHNGAMEQLDTLTRRLDREV